MVVIKDNSLAQGISALGTTLGEILKEKAKATRQQGLLENVFAQRSTPSGEVSEDIEIEKTPPLNQQALFQYALENPQGARFLLEQENAQQKRTEKQEDRAFKRNEKYLEKQDEIRRGLPAEKVALQQMEAALGSGDFNNLRNTIADLTGQEWLKTASAQAVNSASKQFLISSLSSVTGRPNQFLENQITKALISPQYKDKANRLILDGLSQLHELKKMESDLALKLEEKYGTSRKLQPLIQEQVQKKAVEFEKKYQKKLIKALDIKPKKGFSLVIDPEGQVRQVPHDKIRKAKELGGDIINGR